MSCTSYRCQRRREREAKCPHRFQKIVPDGLLDSRVEDFFRRKKQKCSEEDKSSTEAVNGNGNNLMEAVNDSVNDWRDRYKHVRDIHLHALQNNYLADIVFIVGEEKVSLSAHRMILALGSPVFEAMFFGGLAEKGDSVTIPDVDPRGFECLLRFLYCGDVVFDNEVLAFKTFFAADKYCVMSLKNRCERYLKKSKLKASNVWVFLESSLFLNSEILVDRCLTFLKDSTKAALEHKGFLDVTSKTVETFLSLDALSVSEIGLILNLVRWAEHKSQSEQDPVNSFRNFLMPLLKLVRFHNLSHQDFVQFLEMPKLKDMLSDSDSLAILKSIIKPAVCPLPDWCCKKVRHVTCDISVQDSCTSVLDSPTVTNFAENEHDYSSQSRNMRKMLPLGTITDISD